jgi:hypothetical protein
VSKQSGQHKHKACRVPATEDERQSWALAFREDGHVTFAEWARELMNARAETLGYVPATKVGQKDEEDE